MAITKKLIKAKITKYASMIGVSDYNYFVNLVGESKLPKDKYDLYGTVIIDDESREVCMLINKDLLKKSPEELDRTVIHELLHVRLAEILSLFSLICKNYVKDEKAKKTYISQISAYEHKIIASLTNAMTKDKNNG